VAVKTDESTQRAHEQPAAAELYVVGIGASSGGLSALRVLLSSLPAEPGFACVVVTHLLREHESNLPLLLQQHTPMPVQQVAATVPLVPNRVFVIPPNANLNAIDTHLRLSKLEERRNDRAPIDHFLRTLAATHEGTAIGVVLTGAGSDGSIGLRHIKERGGLAIAQDPREAEFDSMPRSAIATGMVDLVLPLRLMADEILQFCATRPQLPVPDSDDEIDARDMAFLNQILVALHKHTQQDFNIYRRGRLLRRLRRRMQLHHVMTFAEYLEILARQPKEPAALANDLHQLAPTEFFRDDATFLGLERRVIPEILDRKFKPRDHVRVWSIGCVTGEEAYSLAMLLVEESSRRPHPVQLQVFASDPSEKMLALAREGIYPREVAASVSTERLQRFFTAEPAFFRVKREIRDLVLFARHDLFNDPPLSHIDLIVCRDLLSDLRPEVRRGVLSVFHYALEPDGLLLVGQRDEVSIPGLVQVDTRELRLFRKVPSSPHAPNLPSSMQPFGPGGVRGVIHAPRPFPGNDGELARVHQSAIESYTPPSVLIDADNEVVHFSSNAAEYLQIPGGEFTQDVTRLVREPLRTRLLEGLRVVRESSKGWDSASQCVHTERGPRNVALHVEPVAASGLILVVFDDRNPLPGSESRNEPAHALASLETEFSALGDHLQGILALRETGVAPLSMQTQLREASEELQSVSEDLATAREELQAVKEELAALDDENHRRVQELTQISTDLQHLLASTGIATLFLDRNLNIVRFTPLLGELFGLRLSDIGRPVADLARRVRYEGFEADAHHVLKTAEPIDREVTSAGGRWYLSRILPYRTEESRIEGVVLTLIDITERKRAELALHNANRNKDEFLAVLAHELRNPLAPISAGVEILKSAAGDRRTVERMAATMGRQTRQLVRLVEDLLEVSRISGGKLHLRKAIIDLREVIQDAIAGAKSSIESAGHAIEVRVPDEPVRIEGDAARLVQVLSNLLNNAVRYTPRPGLISVTAAPQQGSVVVSVKDTGLGIPPDALKNIFDLFYQGRNARSQRGGGLGIGLTLAKTLVEMHGGSIGVDSAGENQGSEFKVELPLANSRELPQANAGELPESEDDQTPTGDRRILIVDDNVDAAETLCMLMKSLGERQVYIASSGSQALETATSLHPDIVLLDLMMPEMDGYEVARRIRRQPWGKELLLVALSGWSHDEHRRRTKEAGFDQHVSKPADIAALRAVLRESRATAPAEAATAPR
jgi:two-component system CheB/CheR fusion protein